MSFRPFGLGPGLFLLILVWTTTLILCIVHGRAKGVGAIIGFNILAGLFTLLITAWPIVNPADVIQQVGAVDEVFIPRIVLLIFLLIVVIRIVPKVINDTLLHTIRAESVKHRHQPPEINNRF